jgi:hypothetical protein
MSEVTTRLEASYRSTRAETMDTDDADSADVELRHEGA